MFKAYRDSKSHRQQLRKNLGRAYGGHIISAQWDKAHSRGFLKTRRKENPDALDKQTWLLDTASKREYQLGLLLYLVTEFWFLFTSLAENTRWNNNKLTNRILIYLHHWHETQVQNKCTRTYKSNSDSSWVASCLDTRVDNFQRKATPILNGASILVGSLVWGVTQELSLQEQHKHNEVNPWPRQRLKKRDWTGKSTNLPKHRSCQLVRDHAK